MNDKALQRSDLSPPTSLTDHFDKVRNLLAGQAEGMTRDQTLVGQLIDLLLCKLHDEKVTAPNERVSFQILPRESMQDLSGRIERLFQDVKSRPEIQVLFDDGEEIELSPSLLGEVVKILEPYEISNASRDVVGEAFESFMGPSLRGSEGQFFTPRNVVNLTCEMINPKSGEKVLDPACGTGGYLTQAADHANGGEIDVFGIDKDSFLARVAAIQVSMLGGSGSGWAYTADSLKPFKEWPSPLLSKVEPESVDVIMTNPPFGSKISVGDSTLTQYHLGRKWKRSGSGNEWNEITDFAKSRPPQILFIERCLDLLRPGGRMGIVLPDGILGNESQGYIRQYVRQVADIVAIVDLPLETFLPSTSTKTSLLFLRKKNGVKQEKIFLATADKCGHDRRGNTIYDEDGEIDDDLPKIADEFKNWRKEYAKDFQS